MCAALISTGFSVVGIDKSPEILDKSLFFYNESRKQRLIAGKDIEFETKSDNITITSDLEMLAACSIIIENVSENIEIKRDLYYKINEICSSDSIILVNTSCIPIGKISEWLRSSQPVAGVHFMNPVPQKSCVEAIAPQGLDPEVRKHISDFLKCMGKRSIWVSDSAGFVTNRILMPMINNAVELVADGIASPAAIDQIFMGCLSHKMGPLATADLIGLDTISNSLDVLLQLTGNNRFTPHPYLSQMIAEGKLGRKSGEGFFKYV